MATGKRIDKDIGICDSWWSKCVLWACLPGYCPLGREVCGFERLHASQFFMSHGRQDRNAVIGPFMTKIRQTVIAVAGTLLLLLGCSSGQPFEAPSDNLPILSLPDLKIDHAGNLQWQSRVSVAIGPDEPTKFQINVYKEGFENFSVNLVINIKRSSKTVASCGSSHVVTVDSPAVLTSSVKLQPGEYEYELILISKGTSNKTTGKFNVTSN